MLSQFLWKILFEGKKEEIFRQCSRSTKLAIELSELEMVSHFFGDDDLLLEVEDEIPLDCDHAIVLYYRGHPVALLGFQIDLYGPVLNKLTIMQIQGFRSSNALWALQRLRWENALVALVIRFAEVFPSSYPTISFQCAERNVYWDRRDPDALGDHTQRFLRRYDGTAKEMGCTRIERDGIPRNFHRTILKKQGE